MKKYALLILLLAGCTVPMVDVPVEPSPTPVVSPTPSPSPTPSAVHSVSVVPALSWDTDPKRKEWSAFIYKSLNGDLFDVYNSAQDNERFCPKFKSLSKEQKSHVWSEMWVWIAKYESNWNPKTSYYEKTMGYHSSGLFQISNKDREWMPQSQCDFPVNEGVDEKIYDPYVNIKCALHIMARQIKRRGLILVPSSPYWAVAYDGKYSKIPEITGKTKELPFCK